MSLDEFIHNYKLVRCNIERTETADIFSLFTTCFIKLIVISKCCRLRSIMVSKVVYQSRWCGFAARCAHIFYCIFFILLFFFFFFAYFFCHYYYSENSTFYFLPIVMPRRFDFFLSHMTHNASV